jgi:hypothetical protein
MKKTALENSFYCSIETGMNLNVLPQTMKIGFSPMDPQFRASL